MFNTIAYEKQGQIKLAHTLTANDPMRSMAALKQVIHTLTGNDPEIISNGTLNKDIHDEYVFVQLMPVTDEFVIISKSHIHYAELTGMSIPYLWGNLEGEMVYRPSEIWRPSKKIATQLKGF